jgi:hypothetical protein
MRAAAMASLMPLWGAPMDAQLVPEAEDFRQQFINKQAGENDWPFAVESGLLSCVYIIGQKFVFFVPDGPPALADEDAELTVDDARAAIVTTDPLQLMLHSGQEKFFVPRLTIEDKIRRLGPYVSLGKRLCDHPKGTVVGPGEL